MSTQIVAINDHLSGPLRVQVRQQIIQSRNPVQPLGRSDEAQQIPVAAADPVAQVQALIQSDDVQQARDEAVSSVREVGRSVGRLFRRG